ncbi:hypothetical protein [Rickettsia tamurae]|uniref:hypothetical protein n=1 Tax=Rickettsia tamurae TaxID=334545 RepID=UPI000A6A1953|nr:hypothetical protein [Rickettsia tamurae]
MYQQQPNISNQYPEECYISQEKGILRTPRNLYNNSLENIPFAKWMRSKEGVTSTVIYLYLQTIKDLQKALVFGIADAATLLAYLCYNGFGDKLNIDKIKLFIAVGKNLGSEICTRYMEGQNDETFDLTEFLQNNKSFK